MTGGVVVLSLQECATWLNVAAAQEESGCPREDVDASYAEAAGCARESGRARLQVRGGGSAGDEGRWTGTPKV